MVAGKKTIDLGISRWWWVPTIAALPAITVAEVTAGTELSKFLLPSSVFQADPTTTVSERDITALFDSDTPTIGKYKGSLTIFRSLLSTGLAGTDDLLTLFSNYPQGTLVRRNGPLATQVLAVADVVDAGQFIADVPQQVAGTGSGFLKITVPLLAQGYYYPKIVLT